MDEQGKLRIAALPHSERVKAGPKFTELPRKTRHGCTLQVMHFSRGGRLFLDSRGLLHFKCPDPDVPEVSIVLADGEIAGWTSDGYVCGPSFFFDGMIQKDAVRVFGRLMKFFTLC
jgi:hypothetical protein